VISPSHARWLKLLGEFLMKRERVFLTIMLGLLGTTAYCSSSAMAQCDPDPPRDTMPLAHRYVVRFKDELAQANTDARQLGALHAAAQSVGGRANRIRRTALGAHVVQFKGVNDAAVARIVRNIRLRSDVEYAIEDRLMKPTFTPNDTLFPQLWGLANSAAGISSSLAWDRTNGSNNVIAVVDTGITAHPDLDANRLPGYDFVSDISRSNDGTGRDSDASDPGDFSIIPGGCGAYWPSTWHGTHVSGTVAAVGNNGVGVIGVAYGAKILPVRVLGAQGGTYSDVADGIVWAAGGSVPGVPVNPNPATVINLSLGGGGACGPVERTAIDYAISRGVAVVVAAGNANIDASSFTPASCPGVITVAATSSTGARASFSNYGPLVEIAAPGVAIKSAYNSGLLTPGVATYGDLDGTSMAAPHVAGVVALMQSIYPRPPGKVTEILQRTAKPFPIPCVQGCGAGIVNADAAVRAAESWPLAMFNAVASSSCPSTTMLYSLSSTSVDPNNDIASYLWNFGDGRTSTVMSPTVKYSTLGPRTVRLTVTDSAGNSSSESMLIGYYCQNPPSSPPTT
jgi:serine protease